MTTIKIGELRDGLGNLAEHVVDQITERGPCAVFLGRNGVCALMTPDDRDYIRSLRRRDFVEVYRPTRAVWALQRRVLRDLGRVLQAQETLSAPPHAGVATGGQRELPRWRPAVSGVMEITR